MDEFDLDVGSKCICQEDEWYNAFGDKTVSVQRGMRLTVIDSKRVGGLSFLSFKETPKDNFYLSTGFRSLRSYN